jgi:two-component system, sensor histidine kinase and response regulator
VREISTPDRSHLRVLVVDDYHTNRQILRNQVSTWKMQVGSAASGEEALYRLRSALGAGKPYDVALLDVQMPEMDGFTLAAAIKGDPALSETRLIVLTSRGHTLRSAELKQLGIETYLLNRSNNPACLIACISQVRSRAKVQAAGVPASSASLSEIEPEFKKAHILLAEDNFINQKVALGQLRRLRYRADSAANGREVMEALSTHFLRSDPYGLSDAGDGRLRDFPSHSSTGKAVGFTVPMEVAGLYHRPDGSRVAGRTRKVSCGRDG